MVNSAKRAKRKRLAQEAQTREASRPAHQMDPANLSDPGTEREEEFASRIQNVEEPLPTPARAQATTDCEIINMVKTLNGAIAAVSQDTARIQRAYDQMRAENMARDKALANLSEMVKEYGSSPVNTRPHPVIQADVLDEEGNLRAKRKRLAQEAQTREASRPAHQMDPANLSDPGTEREEEFASRIQNVEEPLPTPARAQATTDCEIINMVKTLNGAIAAVSQDTARIQRAYDQMRAENMARDKALANLSEMVKEYGSSPVNTRPHPVIQADVLDEEGNLRATDIGITWENNETFLHGVRVVGPGPPCPTGMGPVMSTPYQPMRKQDWDNTSTTALPPTPRTPEAVPDTDIQIRRPPTETH